MQILASEVDFWGRHYDLAEMKLMHKEKMYPPKATVIVYSDTPVSRTAAIVVEIRGMKENELRHLRILKTFDPGNCHVLKKC